MYFTKIIRKHVTVNELDLKHYNADICQFNLSILMVYFLEKNNQGSKGTYNVHNYFEWNVLRGFF